MPTASIIRSGFALSLAAALLATTASARPAGYPRSYDRIVELARKEGRLTIYSNTHADTASELLTDFRRMYPFLRVDYSDLSAAPIYSRFTHEVATHAPTADVIWSSAMDLQAKLINDGYAQTYPSPEKPALPGWAVWKDQGYGVTSEPIVITYNRRLVPPQEVPKSHLDLTRLLEAKPAFYRNRVSSYDPQASEVGLLLLSEDVQATRETWDLVRALGRVRARFYRSAGEILTHVSAGDSLIGYNVIGSYAFERQKHEPNLGVVAPSDYRLAISRIAFIAADARHPNSAKLFLDFLLSRRGQAELARHSMSPVRVDMAASSGTPGMDPSRVRAVQVGPRLLADLDQLARAHLLKAWRRDVETP